MSDPIPVAVPRTPLHPAPWTVGEPFDGCDGKRMSWHVTDDDGTIICECVGDDSDGREAAVMIATAFNRSQPSICAHCGAPATCFGAYEDGLSPGYACDECCGHGCEDGRCEPVGEREGSDDDA